MILEFHPAARDEFLAAGEYYETAVPGLGGRFLVAVTRATDIVLQHPDVGGRRGDRARQLIVTGFPYDLVFSWAHSGSFWHSWHRRIGPLLKNTLYDLAI